ncbi:MAG: C39 family peptidase [Candidatus Pacebacteria bacterium]|nr:C39 family peptidase [Candidatus Paceibacterota bacterium]
MITKRKIFIFTFCFLSLVFFSPLVSAFELELAYPQIPGTTHTPEQCIELGSDEKLACFVKYIYHTALFACGLICFFILINGGILFLISGDSISKNLLARDKISNGLLGTGLLLFSYLILNIINPQLLDLSTKNTVAKCDIDFECPLEMLCENGICISTKPYSMIEQGILNYIEVPLGWLIERVKTRSEIVSMQVNVVNNLAIEQNIPGNTSIQELAKCLKELSKECDCSDLEIECILNESVCSGEIISAQHPCDKQISVNFCQSFGINTVSSNLKTAMENIAEQIIEANDKISQEKENLEIVNQDLEQEKQKLELAEFLMGQAQPPPDSRHNIAYIERTTETLDIWENIKPSSLLTLPKKQQDDPASFYVLEQGNKEIIDIVKSIVFEHYNMPLNPGWIPPPVPDMPLDTDAVILNMPTFLQTDPAWANNQINGCFGNRIATHGCGPTSLAMVLSYFLDPDIKPNETTLKLRKNIEYFCDAGSSLAGLARLAHNDSSYNISYKEIDFNEIQSEIRQGNPVITACSCFGGRDVCWGHISVIKGAEKAMLNGVEKDFIYFQDSTMGEIVFSAEKVKNEFSCYVYFAFSNP